MGCLGPQWTSSSSSRSVASASKSGPAEATRPACTPVHARACIDYHHHNVHLKLRIGSRSDPAWVFQSVRDSDDFAG